MKEGKKVAVNQSVAYPVFIAESGDDFLVYVPDMDLYTEGKSMADAIMMARDAIGLKAIDLEDDGKKVPAPSDYDTALAKTREDTDEFDYTKGIATLVDVDFKEYRRQHEERTVRRTVSLPAWLDYEAEKAGVNVSGVLKEALKNVLQVQR